MSASNNRNTQLLTQLVMNAPLTSRIIIIAIPSDNKVFHVHADKLKETSFFARHGALPSAAQKVALANQYQAIRNRNSKIAVVKVEHGVEHRVEHEATPVSDGTIELEEDQSPRDAPVPEMSQLPDYYLTDRFHKHDAFNIFLQWLYREPPEPVRYRHEARTMLQAYVLAIQYDAWPLQNLIVDRFRVFHATTSMNFDDLLWMANRLGEDLNCPMTEYLLEQTAFDIAQNGFDEFLRHNQRLDDWLKDGQLPVVRLELFKAIARHAKGTRLGDPASGPNEWAVEETGDRIGQRRRPCITL